jgi:hypothetical protein
MWRRIQRRFRPHEHLGKQDEAGTGTSSIAMLNSATRSHGHRAIMESYGRSASCRSEDTCPGRCLSASGWSLFINQCCPASLCTVPVNKQINTYAGEPRRVPSAPRPAISFAPRPRRSHDGAKNAERNIFSVEPTHQKAQRPIL